MKFKYVCINITTRCNMNCPYCYRLGGSLSDMTYVEFLDCLKILKKQGCDTVSITGGEPLVHPEWKKFVKAASDLGFRTILATNTIGLDINDPYLKFIDCLSIPLDSSYENINSITRNRVQYVSAMNFIQKYVHSSFPFKLKINTVITKNNYNFILELADILNFENVIWKLFAVRLKGEHNKLTIKDLPTKKSIDSLLCLIKEKNLKCKVIFLNNDDTKISELSVDSSYLILNVDSNLYVGKGSEDVMIGNIHKVELDDIQLDEIINNQYEDLFYE